MIERRSSGWVVGGYVIVLVGVVGFVVSCFLPYESFQGPAGISFGPTNSYYRLLTTGTGTLQYVAGLLFLFAGAGTVAWVALAGLRHGHHTRRQTPSILVAVTVAWSLSWVGILVRSSAGFRYEVGYWSMLVSVGVVIVGTIVVWVSGRQTAHDPDSAASETAALRGSDLSSDCSLWSGELEEHLLEVEAFGPHLIDDDAGSGCGETDRLGGAFHGHERICRDELGGDALIGKCGAQRPVGFVPVLLTVTGWQARRARTG